MQKVCVDRPKFKWLFAENFLFGITHALDIDFFLRFEKLQNDSFNWKSANFGFSFIIPFHAVQSHADLYFRLEEHYKS